VDFRLEVGMRRRATTVKKFGVGVGAVLILFGATFGLQGLGVIGGSAMSGKTAWAVIGPLIALVGVVLVISGLRPGSGTSDGASSRSRGDESSGSDAAEP
jgi:hypothetical protein